MLRNPQIDLRKRSKSHSNGRFPPSIISPVSTIRYIRNDL